MVAVATTIDTGRMEQPVKDFVLVQGSSSYGLPLLHATRVWRRQVPLRCFFALNDSSLVAALNADPIAQQLNEHYVYYPDMPWFSPARPDLPVIARNPGTRRHAMMLVLAHRHFLSTGYKWMLYGDDDTQFFVKGVKRLVAHFDPEQPLALADHYWYQGSRSNPRAPRCLPCNFNTSLLTSPVRMASKQEAARIMRVAKA
ncbi:hypothetical protein HYH03_013070 [Edaphochlamys debaryana]|uniref:Hexosyltransferase n=1 Tax=Edaphochlamys debaryana TaxID=47281 RepID=A0A836BUU9_9CHLO|nr:hypothetical protein HYH03_013070 [Edaphochlamys debaryana]|eukprot:KAG2488383.1 hypothetical protein HYH03_013070 [Edaphochlamys debaryana]